MTYIPSQLSKEVARLKNKIADVIDTYNIMYTIKLKPRTSIVSANRRMAVTIYKLPLKKLGASRWIIFCTCMHIDEIGVAHVERHALLQCYVVDGKPIVIEVRTRNIIQDIYEEISHRKK